MFLFPRITTSLSPREICLWGAIAFVLLCALCLHAKLHAAVDHRHRTQQQALWAVAPALAIHIAFGSARLSGSVPTESARARLRLRAREIFGADAVHDGLQVQAREVPEDWLDTAVSVLLLAGRKLDNGTISLERSRLRIEGRVNQRAARYALANSVQAVLSEHARLETDLSYTPKHAALARALARMLGSHSLQFAPRSAVLTPAGKSALAGTATLLRKSNALVEIVGHADAVGAPVLSQRLSELRAQAVRDFLVQRGVPAQQLRARGAGAAQAAGSNRRAELRVREDE